MDPESHWKWLDQPQPGAWRDEEPALAGEYEPALAGEYEPALAGEELLLAASQTPLEIGPGPQAQSKLLELLGRINYKILSGQSVYLEVRGIVYKILYGVYWRSVFTGTEHYLLRCEEIVEGMWIEGSGEPCEVDLPISYSEDGWMAKGHTLTFMLYRD